MRNEFNHNVGLLLTGPDFEPGTFTSCGAFVDDTDGDTEVDRIVNSLKLGDSHTFEHLATTVTLVRSDDYRLDVDPEPYAAVRECHHLDHYDARGLDRDW